MKAHTQKGFATLYFVLLALFLVVSIAGSSFLLLFWQQRTSRNAQHSVQAYWAAEAGLEDAVYRIITNKQYVAGYTLGVGESTVSMAISGNTTKTITAGSQSRNVFRNTRAVLVLDTATPQFYYGVQVGEGGVAMGENSRIEGAEGVAGNFYSNGPVDGDNGATITGDVTVATGVTVDVQHTAYNADFSFGSLIGSKITVVDSAGSTGTYVSLAVGTDGFARISFTSGALQFARCTNNDCTTKVITTLDSVGFIDKVTSLVLGSDGFARISYYHDDDDDLKFIRCTNADCTTRNTTIVDSLNNVGDASSLKLGLDGLPRIAYLYDTDNHLRFARCTNADCTAKNITTVDSSGIVGEPHISLAIGADGFARISYYENGSNNDLKFVRCTNDDCTANIITTVDSGGSVGLYTSLVLGSDGYGRISYYDSSNGDLKFVRCTNNDCTTKVLTTVDSGGTVGQYTSLALGSDDFARISYYHSSNGDLKFARCTDADCSAKVISTVDSSSDVGRYSSLRLGADEFGRIGYYDSNNRDLKYVRCIDADCSPSILPGDVAQSFIPTQSKPLAKVSVYLKKVGNPSDVTIRINSDNAGSPAASSLSSTILAANLVGTSYGWVDVTFSTPAYVTSGATYWVVLDGNQNAAKYYVWGYDSASGYANGAAKYSEDWDSKPWFSIDGDMDFKIFLGTGVSTLDNVVVYGTVRANSITNSKICGDAYYQSAFTIDASSKSFLDSPTNPTCGGNPLTPGTGFPDQPDPPVSPMPISDSNINQWKADAQAGGQHVGNLSITSDTSLGPTEITGDLLMTTNNRVLTITGTVYVRGNVDLSGNGSTIQCSSSYGANSCMIVSDGWIHAVNNITFQGSGQSGSYSMFLTTLEGCNGSGGVGCTHHDGAIDVHNNATGAIFYATDSMANLHNGVNVSEIVAYKLQLGNNTVVTYEQGLLNAQFSAGPGASWELSSWQEIE